MTSQSSNAISKGGYPSILKQKVNRFSNLFSFIILFYFICLSNVSHSQILTFDFAGIGGNEASVNSNFNNANLNASVITRGAGLTASTNGDRFNATNWAITSIANAVAGNDYMEFTIAPLTGFQFTISSITIQLQRSATGFTDIALRSSVDSYGTNLDAIKNVTDNTSTQSFTFTFAQAPACDAAITYRFYAYSEAAAGTGGIGDGAGNDIVVNGTVTSCGSNTITTGAITGAPFVVDCTTSDNGTIDFTSVGTYNVGNVYTAQLSNSAGSFASPSSIGTLSSTANSGTINITIPALTASGANYKIRVVSSSPVVTGTETAIFTITLSGTPCESITPAILSGNPFAVDCTTSDNGTIDFTSTGSYIAGNVYTAQLSNSAGSFASPTSIGTLTSNANSGTINLTIPAGIATGASYKIRIISSTPAVTSTETAVFTVTLSGGPCGTIMYNENFHQANIICCDGSNDNAFATHESNHRFSEDALTYSGSGTVGINSASNSVGYVGASGGFHALLNNSSESLIMNGLDLSTCGGLLSLQFGVSKSTAASNGSGLTVEYSSAGAGGPWTSVAKPLMLTGAGTSNPAWYFTSTTGIIPNTANAFRFITTDAVTFRIDDIKVVCSSTVPCAVTSEPTTSSSAITASPSCNSVDITFTAGNGNNRIIVMSSDCTITDPVDLTSYLGNRDYGTGSSTSANDFVVYTGSGNSVNVFNLLPSTSYCFKIYEYNKKSTCTENYLMTVTTTFFTTSACNGASLTGVMVNSCAAACQEGNNELVFGNSGATSFVASAANLKLSYGFNTPLVVADQYTDNLTTVPATTSALNTEAGCAGLFIEGTGATIPANSNFMLASSSLCEEAFDWTTLCANGPIYVIYTTDPTWQVSGNFTNTRAESNNRYFKLNITNTSGATTSVSYAINTGLLTSNADGDFLTLDADGGFATSYDNNGCVIDPAILPVSLKSLNAHVKDDILSVDWTTASERNNNYFEVLLSDDSGMNFKTIGTIKGAGTSSVENNYSFQMNDLGKGLFYVRLKQVDFDSRYYYSEIKSVKNSDGSLEVIKTKNNQLILSKDLKRGSNVGFFDITGKQLASTKVLENTDKIEIPSLVKGLVILKIENEVQGVDVFKLILE